MAVQSYYDKSFNSTSFDVEELDEWKLLAKEMGLDNQLAFVEHAKTPNPFPNMNNSTQTIMKTLCPTIVEMKAYTKSTIPLEVMQLIGASVRDNQFQRIEIWYDDKTLDPIAVGITEKYFAYNDKYNRMEDSEKKTMLFNTKEEVKPYAELVGFNFKSLGTDNVEKYLIARWGDVLKSDEELKKMANERLMEKYGAELRNEIEERVQALKKLTDNIILYLNGDLTEGQLKGARW
jgi:hypothetical protein